jgi:hypothetical protein
VDLKGAAWIYTRRADLTAHDVARRKVDLAVAVTQQLRMADTLRVRPDRDMKLAPVATATQRPSRTRPTIGDTVPELRGDPQTMIPVPTQRRLRDEWRDDPRYERGRSAASPANEKTGSERARDRGSESAPAAGREVLRPVFGSATESRPREEPLSGARKRDEGATHSLGERARRESAGEPRSAAPRLLEKAPPPPRATAPPRPAETAKKKKD